jgi:hypothetical protein
VIVLCARQVPWLPGYIVALIGGAPPQPARLMQQAEFHRHVGDANIVPNVQAALDRADVVIGTSSPPSRAAG